VSNIDGLGRPHGRALLESAVAIDADLIVIGGYGHTRAAELVFGGVTNDLAAACPIPLLLSH
jgi:nucleotide-binding universal stress UspA family protein